MFLAPVRKHSSVISPSGDSLWSITSEFFERTMWYTMHDAGIPGCR